MALEKKEKQYKKYYLNSLNSSEDERVKFALMAICNMEYIEALPEIEKIIKKKDIASSTKELAHRVKECLSV